MPKDYVFTPPPNWPPPPRGWVPPAGWTPDPEWGPAPEGWEFWIMPEGGTSWVARHPLLTGVGATSAVIGTVVTITAFANGSGGRAPLAAATSPTLLTALDDSGTDPTTPEQSLSQSTDTSSTEPTTSTTRATRTTTPSPTTSTVRPSPTATSPDPSPTRTVTVYRSCRRMNQDHPHGVGRPGATDRPRPGQQEVKDFEVNGRLYAANRLLDRDGDGIACER